MNHPARLGAVFVALLVGLGCGLWAWATRTASSITSDREEVVFWHFWGGADRDVVDQIVSEFNASQDVYQVRAVAMPGNNLDLKLFLAVTGGDPPDLVNQDDPIVADWAVRGALTPLDEIASEAELEQLEDWLQPAARRLGQYGGRRYALCNGLDIRALYYNKSLLDELQLDPPESLAELDQIATAATAFNEQGRPTRFGYLPDPRRLWAWGVVFGGSFYDHQTRAVTAAEEPLAAALSWMTAFRTRYGAKQVAAFRQGDQSLPGKTFPLLADRYAMVMDGQWRVRDIRNAQAAQRQRGETVTQYGVCPLPPPAGGRAAAGWVNGNFFLVPRGARQPGGAWEFMKYWCGFGGRESTAAEICIRGGWIPVSQAVVRQPRFQKHLSAEPLFAQFVTLARSEHQIPTPVIPGAPFFYRTINQAAATAMYTEPPSDPTALLQSAAHEIQQHLDSLEEHRAHN